MEPLTSQDVQAALEAAGLDIRIMWLEQSGATAQLAADAIGTSLGSIVKSLLFMAEDQPVLVLTAGDKRVHDGKLAQLFNVPRKRVRIATPDECLHIAGYEPGGVPPVGHRRRDFPILIDQTLTRFETVYAAAGAHDALFPIPLQTLIDITGASLQDVVKDSA